MLLLCSILLVHCIFGQIANESTLLFIKQTGLHQLSVSTQCCEHIHDYNSLYNCILNSQRSIHAIRSMVNVTLYTFVSENILQYAAYGLAINAFYAQQNQYNFEIIGASKEHPYNESDARWNKVQMLLNGVKTVIASSDNYMGKYLVWLDADLILLDMKMKIELIAEAYPSADIIMSKDIARAEFVANSGFIIVRVSLWVQQFLERWWRTYDRRRCCDQNAFTWLYDDLNSEDLQHIALLRADAINSNFPAWKHQEEFNQVLHLAGGSSLLFRKPIFTLGFGEICKLEDGGENIILHQLGLHRSVLVAHVSSLGRLRLDALSRLNLSTNSHNTAYECDFQLERTEDCEERDVVQSVMQIRSTLEDILKDDDDDCKHMYELDESSLMNYEELIQHLRKWIYESLHRISMKESDNSLAVVALGTLEILKDAISAGFEYVLSIQEFQALYSSNYQEKVDQQQHILRNIHPLLQAIHDLAPSTLEPKTLYYKFKHAQLMATTFPATAKEKIEWLTYGVELWHKLAANNYFGSDYVMADPYKEGGELLQELGTLLCNRRDFDAGLEALKESVMLHEKTLDGYEKIRIAARKDIFDGMVNLAETLINAGICSFERGGHERLGYSIDVLQKAQALLKEKTNSSSDRVQVATATAQKYIELSERILAVSHDDAAPKRKRILLKKKTKR